MSNPNLKAVIIGRPGSGKTHFIYDVPKAVIIETDPHGEDTLIKLSGYYPTDEEQARGWWKLKSGSLVVTAANVTNPAQTLKIISDYLVRFEKGSAQAQGYESLVIDSLSFTSEASRRGVAGVPDSLDDVKTKLTYSDWGEISGWLRELLIRLAYLKNANVIITCLADVRDDPMSPRKSDGTHTEQRIYPKVDTGVRDILGAYFSTVAYLETRGDVMVVRTLYLKHARADVKCRLSDASSVPDPTYSKLYSTIYSNLINNKKESN